jgi:uncharacterized protein YneF (UPF0154 family)
MYDILMLLAIWLELAFLAGMWTGDFIQRGEGR